MSEEKRICYPLNNSEGQHKGWMIMCPGCKIAHSFDFRWTFNGNYERPTFRNSLLVRWDMSRHGMKDRVCHSYVTDGHIQFLGDCTHELANKTVPLEAF